MACSDCGQGKGHMDGCPQKNRDKRGGSGRGRQDKTDGKGSLRTPMCMETGNDENPAQHPGIRHVCGEKKRHSGAHRCGGCGATY